MQFSVPQFIDIEDRIIGPLTLKQFLYFLGAAAIIFVLYTFLTTPFLIITGVPVAGIAAMFAFYKPNGRPFTVFVGSILRYITRPRLYMWERTAQNREIDEVAPTKKEVISEEEVVHEVSESRLQQLAWVLDTSGGLEELQTVAENIRSTIPEAQAQGQVTPAPAEEVPQAPETAQGKTGTPPQ